MGRKPCCSKEGLNRGAWSTREDKVLRDYINTHGEGKWRDLPRRAGLNRCGKSCRLRWLNYLRPDIKRGNISPDEEELIVRLHKLLGNRWSLIAGRLPGRTDNEIKNYWNTHLSKKVPSPPSIRQGSTGADRAAARKQTRKVIDVDVRCTSHETYVPDNNSSEPTSTDPRMSTSSPFDTFLDLPYIDFDVVEEFMAGFEECSSGFDQINPLQLYDADTTQEEQRRNGSTMEGGKDEHMGDVLWPWCVA